MLRPDPRREDKLIQGYTAALKAIQLSRRSPRKGEKVYPIDLNLRNADLVEAVRVLADTLGLNYLIDPRVKGTANVRASGKMSQSELLSILETLLLVNQAALVRAGKVYKIVPLDKLSGQAMPVYARGVPPVGMLVQVVFLEQTVAKQVEKVLKPMVSPGGSITEAPNNSLILVDYPANLEKLLKLIRLIDSRALAKTMIRIVKVHNTDPNDLISELEVIFSAYGTLAQKQKFGVSFLPVTRLNSVLVLADSQALLDRALYWVQQLDLKSDMLANVHVYHVENYKALNLADLLTQVYGGAPTAPATKEVKTKARRLRGFGPVGAAEKGTAGTGAKSLTGLDRGRRSLERMRSPAEAAKALKQRAVPLPGAAAPGITPKEGVRIIPDEENNLLVVVAPPHEWRIISKLLKRLDIMPRQVLNEVLIAEVRLTGDLKYGIEWYINSRLVEQQTASSTSGTSTTEAKSSLEILTGASAAFSTALGGFTFAARDAANKFRGMIKMLAEDGKVNILASPHIMAANNQEAYIQIGEEVPILTSKAVPLVAQAVSYQTQTVQYRSTGIILTVKPQINAKGLVTLDITQEVSAAVPTTTGVSDTPTFTIRQAETSLITGDNQTIVLGGLIREDVTRKASGVPGLRRLPLLGPLFGTETVSRVKTELLVLITPHIITSLEGGARITKEVKDRIHLEELRPEWEKGGPAAPPAPAQ